MGTFSRKCSTYDFRTLFAKQWAIVRSPWVTYTIDPHQRARFVAPDLCLLYVFRPFCPNSRGRYGKYSPDCFDLFDKNRGRSRIIQWVCVWGGGGGGGGGEGGGRGGGSKFLSEGLIWSNYRTFTTYSDRQTWTNSVDASDLGVHCLPLIQKL